MLHNEARKLLVKAFEETHDAQTVAKCFQVTTSTVYRLIRQMKKTGSVDLQTSQRGRKASLSEENLHDMDRLITSQPDITIDEIIEALGLTVTNETVRKAVIRMGYVYKKKSFHAAERERVRCPGRMDNMRTHHVKEVQTLLQDAGMKALYLPAYSPDLNPIENMWSKVKAILRKLKVRSSSLLSRGIADAFSLIRPSDCRGWFSAAGVCC